MSICLIYVRSEVYLLKFNQKWNLLSLVIWDRQMSVLVPRMLRTNSRMNSQIYVFSCTFCNGCEALLRFSWCARSPEISLFSVKMCDFPARRREYFDFPARRADFIVLIRGGGPRIFPYYLPGNVRENIVLHNSGRLSNIPTVNNGLVSFFSNNDLYTRCRKS